MDGGKEGQERRKKRSRSRSRSPRRRSRSRSPRRGGGSSSHHRRDEERDRHRSSSHHHSSSHRRRRSRSRSPDGGDDERVRAARKFLEQQQQQHPCKPPSSSSKPRPQHVPEIDAEEDYFRRSNEFAAWLPGAKGRRFDGLPADEARRLFREFAADWNAGRVEHWLYDERKAEERAKEGRTAHKWSFKVAPAAAAGAGAAGGGGGPGRPKPPPPAPAARRAPPEQQVQDERLKRAQAEEAAKMAGLRAMLARGPIQIAKREPPPPQ